MKFKIYANSIGQSLENNTEKIKTSPLKTPMFKMLVLLVLFFGLLFLYKWIQGLFISNYMAKAAEQPVTVSAMEAAYQEWQPQIKASGSTRAVLGIDVTTEVAGLVRKIYFTPGATVADNELLLELNSDTDVSQLASLEAALDLSKITYQRDLTQFKANAVSKSTVDTDLANLKSNEAQVDKQKATIAKKFIRAPFSGHLGISLVYPGQYLNPGDKIVSLQALNPIYLDFFIPQQYVNKINFGQSVELTTDAYPNKKFTGKITTINPGIDPKTRNMTVEATIENAESLLRPGMFGNVVVNTGSPQQYLTLPQTAITYNPYGDIIYLIKEKQNPKNSEQKIYTVQQTFVVTGDTRGDQVAIISGIKVGDKVVTSGQMKLKNDTVITINNEVVPSFNAHPVLKNEE